MKPASQIKLSSGNEIYSPAKGKSEVRGSNGEVKFAGTYRQCVKWAKDRGLKMVG